MKSLSNKFKKAVVWMITTGFILTSCKVPDNSQGGGESTNALTPPSKPANEQLLQLGQTVYHLMFAPPNTKGSAYRTYVKDSNPDLDKEAVSLAVKGGNLRGSYFSKSQDTKRTVIMIHGLTSSSQAMEPIVPLFMALGFNVLTPDLRGHGQSIQDFPYKTMGIKDSQDVLGWINFLKTQKDQKEFVLYGISLGAITSLQAGASINASEVKAIIEDCAFPDMMEFLPRQYEALLLGGVGSMPPEQDAQMRALVEKIKAVNDIDQVINAINYALYNDSEHYQGEHIQLEQGISKTRDLAKGKVPLLIIHGEQDGLMPFRMADEIKKSYGYQSLIRTFYVKEANHAESFSKDPVGYQKAVKEFLGEVFKF